MTSFRITFGAAVVCATIIAANGQSPTGITVSPPKAFDSRTLTLQMEDLKRRLDSVRGLPVSGIQGALGNVSGARFREQNVSIQGSYGGSNNVITKETPVDGALTPTERTTTGPPAARAAIPTGTDPSAVLAAPAALMPTLSAADRLIEAANLEYQINTLQSFLERSVTDRIIKEPTVNGVRLQALLGFRVSISPPRGADGKAAIIRITVHPKASSKDGENGAKNAAKENAKKGDPAKALSVVALMPSQKSYNVFAIDRKRNAFGGAAMMGAFSIAGSFMQRSETMYVYKASDTEAYSAPDPGDESVVFGWEFRPVLGRKSVAPGERQMFALIALPNADSGSNAVDLTATAEVQWMPFNEGKGTFGSAFKKAGAFVPSFENVPVSVHTSEGIQAMLSPSVTFATWTPVGSNGFVAAFEGKAFFTGTKIAYGTSLAQATESGLEITSDTTMRVTGKLSDLMHGEPVLQGRYGGAAQIAAGTIKDATKNSVTLPFGFVLGDVKNVPTISGSATVRLTIEVESLLATADDGAKTARLPDRGFLVAIDDQALGAPMFTERISCVKAGPVPEGAKLDPRAAGCLRMTYQLPGELMKKPSALVVRYPFFGPAWAAYQPLEPLLTDFQVIRLGQTDPCQYDANPVTCVTTRDQKLAAEVAAAKESAAKARQDVQTLSSKHTRPTPADTSALIKSYYGEAKATIDATRVEAERSNASKNDLSALQATFERQAEAIMSKANQTVESELAKLPSTAKPPSVTAVAESEKAKASDAAAKPIQPIEDVVLAIRGPGASACWEVRVGGLPVTQKPDTGRSPAQLYGTLIIAVKANLVKGFDNLLLLPYDQEGGACTATALPQILKIPKEKPEAEKPAAPTFVEATSLKAVKGSAPLLEVKGTGLDQIKFVRFADRLLGFIPDEKGVSIKIALTRDVTADLGPATLLVDLTNGKVMNLQIQITKPE